MTIQAAPAEPLNGVQLMLWSIAWRCRRMGRCCSGADSPISRPMARPRLPHATISRGSMPTGRWTWASIPMRAAPPSLAWRCRRMGRCCSGADSPRSSPTARVRPPRAPFSPAFRTTPPPRASARRMRRRRSGHAAARGRS